MCLPDRDISSQEQYLTGSFNSGRDYPARALERLVEERIRDGYPSVIR